MTRDASGRATVRAVRLTSPLKIDGRLDEPVYESVPSMWKNEVSNLVPIPAAFGNAGHFRAISLAATLVGLEAPPGSKNLEIKPYVVSSLTTDNTVLPRLVNDVTGDFGADLKYGITQNLTADFTYNTDFAQVEADEQQINLTRFSLFFPEKRDFFLENQGIYEFGGVGGLVASAATAGGGTANVPVLFYSRRIGLDQNGGAIPIGGGGRVTGRVGKFSLASRTATVASTHGSRRRSSRSISTTATAINCVTPTRMSFCRHPSS